jgi:hypothetical protein
MSSTVMLSATGAARQVADLGRAAMPVARVRVEGTRSGGTQLGYAFTSPSWRLISVIPASVAWTANAASPIAADHAATAAKQGHRAAPRGGPA